jgi:translocation and assembly module TamB
VTATARGASIEELMRFAPSKKAEALGLAGKTDAAVEAAWTRTISNLVAHVRARIYGPLRPPSPGTIPVNGFLDVRYDGPRDRATFAPSSLQTANAKISFDGTWSKNTSLTIDANEQKLSELSPLVSSLASSTATSTSATLNALGLRGSATFTGQVEGSPSSPRISGQFAANHVFVNGTYLATVKANLKVGSSGIAVRNAVWTGTLNGQLTMNGQVGLRRWSFTKTSPVSLELRASGVSVPDLMRLARVNYQFPGKLDANVSVRGSEENPAGHAEVSISEASPRSKKRTRELVSMRELLSAHLEGNGNLVHLAAQLNMKAGQVSAQLAYAPKTQHYAGQISAPSFDLSKLKFAKEHGLTLRGTASFRATGNGTIQHPQVGAKLEIPALEIQGQTISAIRSQFQVADRTAKFAMSSTVVGGYVDAKGEVALRGAYPATASLDVRALSIAPLLAKYEPQMPSGLQGLIEFDATLDGPLKQPEKITAQVRVPTFEVSYDAVHLALAAPTDMHYANGQLAISRTEMKGSDTDLIVQGAIPVKSARPMNVSANGSFNLDLLQTLGVGIRSSGRLILHLAARGEIAHPQVSGDVRISSATFLSETLPIAVESLNATMRVTGTRVDIQQFGGTIGGGSVSMTGFFEYAPQPTFHLRAQAQSVRIRYPQGIRTLLDAKVALVGSTSASTLSGRVLVNRLSFTRQFDIATLIGQFSSSVPAAPPSAFEQNMKLKVVVASTSALNLASSTLSIGGNFNLTIAGTAADPVVLGRVALSQGDIFFMGNTYEIQSGTIEFANPVRTEPVLNIYAKTTVNQFDITLNFVGPIDRLRTNYTSTPPLSEADIIHLIAFGTTAEEAAASPSVPTSVAAESILAQGVSSQVAGKLEKLTGISQITIDPLVTDSSGTSPGSQIGIQERVSGSLLLTFSTSVTDTQEQTVEVEYSASKDVRISVLRDYNGGYALDVRLRKTF